MNSIKFLLVEEIVHKIKKEVERKKSLLSGKTKKQMEEFQKNGNILLLISCNIKYTQAICKRVALLTIKGATCVK